MKRFSIITLLTVLSYSYAEGQLLRLSSEEKFVAGTSIKLCFNSDVNQRIHTSILTLQHNMGIEVVHQEPNSPGPCFKIPDVVARKAGLLTYRVYNSQRNLLIKGNIEITPNTTVPSSIEAYCGPKHLITGNEAFTMITATALDTLDNPYPAETNFEYSYSAHGNILTRAIQSKPLYSFTRFGSPLKAGYGATSVSQGESTTQEFRLSFYAHDPEDFSIAVDREHDFADANQLIRFSTDKLIDKNGNIIGDGNQVVFTIKNDQKVIAQALSHTIGGVAEVTMLAPDRATTWEVSAQVPFFAQSNSINISFKADIQDYPVSNNNSGITVGPVKGYMRQRVKDGIAVELYLTGQGKTQKFITTLSNGTATFQFKDMNIPEGLYQASISISGVTKEIKDIQKL